MGLLSKLKSLLGMEEESRSPGSGVDVTVERESSTGPERAGEESAEGGEDASPAGGDEASTIEDGDVDEPVASEAGASASTESLVDEGHTEDPTRAAEPGEAGVAEGESSTDEAAATGDGADGEPVSAIKGIGPAYADRLEEAGVATVDDLAAADPEDLADQTDLSAKRVGRWIDSAQDHD